MPPVARGDVEFAELVERCALLTSALSERDQVLATLDLHSKVSVTDRSGIIIDVNGNFCRLSGYSREELLGQPHSIVKSGIQDQAFWSDMWATVVSGRSWRGNICNLAKDGSLHWLDSVIAPCVGKDGLTEKYISIRTDITLAIRNEQRLLASESFLDRTGRTAGIGGWQFDIDGSFMHWSAHMNRIHETPAGFRPTLAEGLNFYPPPFRPVIEAAMFEAIKAGKGWDLELPLVTARHRNIWVRSVGAVERVDGKPVRIIGSTQDITARKQIEKSLNYERDLLSSMLETLPDQIYFKDSDSKYLRVNAGMARYHGIKSPAEAMGKSDADYFPEAHARQTAAIERQIMDTGVPVLELEEQALWADRPPTWSLTTRMPLYDAEDSIVGTFGISRDITQRKRLESQLTDMITRFATAADSAGIGVWEFDSASASFDWDDWMFRIYGTAKAPRSVTFSTWTDSLHVQDRSRCEREFAAALRGEKEFNTELRIVRPGGEIRYLKVASHTLQDSSGKTTRLTGVTIDVTEHRCAEIELIEMTKQAEQASRAKSEFLANMSHEIRTPMSAVIGLSYLLAQMPLDPPQRALLSKIQVSSKSLLGVISDILDLSKIEAGELMVECESFDLPGLLVELTDVMATAAHAKGITLEIDLASDLPGTVQGDATRLTQILTNLMSNAIKFTERGGVTVRVTRLDHASTGAKLCFLVADTGIGIPAEAQRRLFTPFAQADASITRRYGGTGLGLSIVKKLANLLGGDVQLKSSPGGGSEFRVVLNFAALVTSSPAIHSTDVLAPGDFILRKMRILVVDDSDINLEVTKRILELNGARVSLANNGQKAIDLLRAAPADCDIVLMDVQMPILNGYDATRRIRGELGLVDLPVLALTAGALNSERQRGLAAGMDDFISKPFDAPTLVRSILRHVEAARRRPRPPTIEAA